MEKSSQTNQFADGEEWPVERSGHPAGGDIAKIPGEGETEDQSGRKRTPPSAAAPTAPAVPSTLWLNTRIRLRSYIRRREPGPTPAPPRAQGSGIADPRSARNRANQTTASEKRRKTGPKYRTQPEKPRATARRSCPPQERPQPA